MKKKIFMACIAFATGLSAIGQIAAWDFFGQSFPVTCAATTFNANLVSAGGASDITRGPGAAASGGVNSFRTTGFQNNGISTGNADYFQITLRASPGYKLSLSTLDAKFNGTSTFFASPGVTSQFAYSLDGTAFTLIGSPVQSTSLTMAQVNLSTISDLQNVYATTTVTIRYYASGQTATGGWGFYSGAAGTNGLSVGGTVTDAIIVPPTIQASDITFSNIGQTQLSLSWTPGNGDKRVVMINTANDFTPPANGTDPSANTAYSGSGQQVVYNYSGSSIPAITGLVAGFTYWFRIYEYNGAGSLTQYNTGNGSNNPNSQATSTEFLPPTVTSPTVSAIAAETVILGGHITKNGGSTIIERGTVWSTLSPVTISDHFLAEGGTDTGVFVHPRSGLPSGTKIYFTACGTNGIGSALAMESSFYTLALEPPGHVTGFSANATGSTSIDLFWTPLSSGVNGYLILRKQGTAASVSVPLDAVQYLPGTTIGDATVAAVVQEGSTGNQTIPGLSPGTSYAFTIFPFSWDGTNPETTNYLTIPVIPEATATTSIPAVAIYHWSGMVSTDFANPENWDPERTIPALNDILIFDNGISATLTNVVSQTIGQLMVNSNTAITLQGGGTLAIAGDEGADLMVSQGCQLNVSGSGVLAVSLSSAATGQISGSMTLSGGGHRLLAAASGGITFQAGSSFKTGSGFTGNPFGTVNLNSVVFSSGSTYICQAGGNPFGAAAPSSVVVFQTGSLYRLDAYAVPSFGGRTYGNFEMNYTGVITVTGSSAVSIDNFTASQGFFYFNLTGNPGHSIKGSIFVSAVATLVFSPSSPGTVNLDGNAPQTISGTGAIIAGQNSTLVVGNSAGVTLSANAELNHLTISSGARFTISPNATLTVGGDLINMGPETGFIIKSDGSLIHGTEGVQGIVERNVAAAGWNDWQNGWHFISSPVATQTINQNGGFVTTGSGNDYDLYAWWEPGDAWINFKNTTVSPTFTSVNGSANFEPGKGYLVAYEQSGIKQFSGLLRTSDLQVSNLGISGTSPNNGWHLLGNPFASSLTWFTDWNPVNIVGVAMIWNEAGMSYTPVNAGETIPPLNGFMVQVAGIPGTIGSLTIPAAGRVQGNQLWYKSEEIPAIKLYARNLDNLSFQESQIRFNPHATTEFEPETDGRFLPGLAPVFYSKARDECLIVNSVPGPAAESVIPFIFMKNEGTRFQIEARITGSLPAMVLLTDHKTGIEHNLSLNPFYSFMAFAGDNPDRFAITFSHVGNTGYAPEKITIWSDDQNIFIKMKGRGEIEVISLSGKIVLREEFDTPGLYQTKAELPTGCHLVKLTTERNVIVKKLLF